jgi:hypothetical protein
VILGAALLASGEGPYTIIAAVAAVIGVLLLTWIEFIAPAWRRYRLRNPCEVRFVIRGLDHAEMPHLILDDETHIVDELVLPSHSLVEVEIGYIPRLPLFLVQMVVGCEGDINQKPFAVEALARFTEAGKTSFGPGEDGHSRDIHKHWHIRRETPRSVGTHYVTTLKMQTRGSGVYPLTISFITDEIEGNASLMLRVEDVPRTRMRCRAKGHRGCLVRPDATFGRHSSPPSVPSPS